jgi:VIT1/CCC1 family predicted Fe2+/Mn2+ transporter
VSGSSDVHDHVTEARERARQVLGGEAHLGAVDDWRRAFVCARDAIILICLSWAALEGLGIAEHGNTLLIPLAIGVSLLFGISAGRSTLAQVQYYESELARERAEIRDHFAQEQEEVRALYAAKGFTEPLLSQIVEVLSADDDRLLKVMMEEELGLLMHHMHHPLIVGMWNLAGAAAVGLILTVPLVWLGAETGRWWMMISGVMLLAVVAVASSRVTGRRMLEPFAASVVMAVVTGGVVYFLAQWLAGVIRPVPGM